MAERQRFELWVGYKPTTVFKTAALNHSAISPRSVYINPTTLKSNLFRQLFSSKSGSKLKIIHNRLLLEFQFGLHHQLEPQFVHSPVNILLCRFSG